ncbi:MAG: YncE family protein [Bacteroidetes bacterium]|nr:YncE family protein [Bacteroidota bacterium]
MKKFFLLATTFISITSFAQLTGMHVLDTFHIKSDGGWDYIAVNHEMNRVYVSHGTQVNILNETTGDSVGIIPNTTGVHGIAWDAALNKGFTSNGRINSVTEFDLKTNAVLKQIPVGENPDAILFDPFTKMIYTCNGRSSNMSVIDPAKDTVVATISLDGRPETAVWDSTGKIYVNLEDKSRIQVIDAMTNKVTDTWKLGSGESPSGLAIDRKKGRLFSGCENKLMIVLDVKSGKIISEVPIGDGCDGTAFDPGTGNAYSSNGEGTLTVVHENADGKYFVTETVATKKGARTLSVDTFNHKIFLPTADLGEIPEATKDNPRPRPKKIPGTFCVLVVGI